MFIVDVFREVPGGILGAIALAIIGSFLGRVRYGRHSNRTRLGLLVFALLSGVLFLVYVALTE